MHDILFLGVVFCTRHFFLSFDIINSYHHLQIRTFYKCTKTSNACKPSRLKEVQVNVSWPGSVKHQDATNIWEPKLFLALFSARGNFGSQMLFCHDILSWGVRSCLEHLEASQHNWPTFQIIWPTFSQLRADFGSILGPDEP